MKRRSYVLGLIALTLLSLMVLGVEPAPGADEPATGVGRVSVIHGDVSSLRGDSGDWVASTVNAPVVPGDKVATGERSRAEIQLDYANVLRLGEKTEVKIADLNRTRIQLQVVQGIVTLTVFKGSEAELEVDTPNMAVRPLEEGTYRVQVSSPSETQLIVRKGEAEVATPQGNTKIENNKVIYVQGTDNPEYQIAKAPQRDDWDEWNRDRDAAIQDAASWKYTNRYYTGAQDLDRYGRWVQVPDYGWSWSPSVDAYWAPYRYGRWNWQPYWGWTWVSYEPWGWAPYHYGRWFYWNSSWCWWPGSTYYGYYPTWAPAYVSFIGFGWGNHRFHFGSGYGFNSIGWLPLGPRDHFNPWWGRHNQFNVVNITNVTNINNITNFTNTAEGIRVRRVNNQPWGSNFQGMLTNTRVRQAITTVPTEDFVRGRVPARPQAVDLNTLRQGHVVQGTLPAVPTRESLRPIDRAARAPAGARAANSERFFTRRPAPASPTPFTEQAAGVRQMVERHNPLQGAEGRTPARGAGAASGQPVVRSERGLGTQQAASPGQAFGNPNQAARGAAPSGRPEVRQSAPAMATGGRSGWQRFGGSSENGLARQAAPSSGAVVGEERGQRTGTAPQNATPQSPRSSWQRFGAGQPRAMPERPVASGASASPRSAERVGPPAAPQREGVSPAPSPAPNSGQRLGTGEIRTRRLDGTPGEGAAPRAPAQTPGVIGAPRSQAASEATPDRSGWRSFSSTPGAGRARPTPSESPRVVGSPGPTTFRSQPAPASGARGAQGGWRQFTPETRSVPAGGNFGRSAAPGDRSGGEPSGGGRSPSRFGGGFERQDRGRGSPPDDTRFSRQRAAPAYGQAPRGYERPPLEIRKPIVTERAAPAPRSFQGGGNRGWSTPSSGGNRGSSAPSGGGVRGGSSPRSASPGGFHRSRR